MRLIFIILLLAASANVFSQELPLKKDLKAHVYFLASDSLEGRDTGKEGQKKAAEYIKTQFTAAGLKPLPQNNNAYFQQFEILYGGYASGQLYTESDSAFCYYLSDSPVDLAGKKLVFIPAGTKETAHLKPDEVAIIRPKDYEELIKMSRSAAQSECTDIMIIPASETFWQEIRQYFQNKKKTRLSSDNFETIEQLSEKLSFTFLSEDGFKRMFKQGFAVAGPGGQKPETDLKIRNTYTAESLSVLHTENVIGCIEGQNTEKYIAVTAHYDHIGKNSTGIFNGADDNASGTAAIIEAAKYYASADEKPEVSLVFIAFSGEEKGLFGSEYFVNSNLFTSAECILNINADMIGKSIKYGIFETFKYQQGDFTEDTTMRQDYVYVFNKGGNTAKTVRSCKKTARRQYKFKIDKSPGLLTRLIYKRSSDHYNFFVKEVPVIVLFTGLHPDYHTIRDTADKLDYENLTTITHILIDIIRKYSENT